MEQKEEKLEENKNEGQASDPDLITINITAALKKNKRVWKSFIKRFQASFEIERKYKEEGLGYAKDRMALRKGTDNAEIFDQAHKDMMRAAGGGRYIFLKEGQDEKKCAESMKKWVKGGKGKGKWSRSRAECYNKIKGEVGSNQLSSGHLKLFQEYIASFIQGDVADSCVELLLQHFSGKYAFTRLENKNGEDKDEPFFDHKIIWDLEKLDQGKITLIREFKRQIREVGTKENKRIAKLHFKTKLELNITENKITLDPNTVETTVTVDKNKLKDINRCLMHGKQKKGGKDETGVFKDELVKIFHKEIKKYSKGKEDIYHENTSRTFNLFEIEKQPKARFTSSLQEMQQATAKQNSPSWLVSLENKEEEKDSVAEATGAQKEILENLEYSLQKSFEISSMKQVGYSKNKNEITVRYKIQNEKIEKNKIESAVVIKYKVVSNKKRANVRITKPEIKFINFVGRVDSYEIHDFVNNIEKYKSWKDRTQHIEIVNAIHALHKELDEKDQSEDSAWLDEVVHKIFVDRANTRGNVNFKLLPPAVKETPTKKGDETTIKRTFSYNQYTEQKEKQEETFKAEDGRSFFDLSVEYTVKTDETGETTINAVQFSVETKSPEGKKLYKALFPNQYELNDFFIKALKREKASLKQRALKLQKERRAVELKSEMTQLFNDIDQLGKKNPASVFAHKAIANLNFTLQAEKKRFQLSPPVESRINQGKNGKVTATFSYNNYLIKENIDKKGSKYVPVNNPKNQTFFDLIIEYTVAEDGIKAVSYTIDIKDTSKKSELEKLFYKEGELARNEFFVKKLRGEKQRLESLLKRWRYIGTTFFAAFITLCLIFAFQAALLAGLPIALPAGLLVTAAVSVAGVVLVAGFLSIRTYAFLKKAQGEPVSPIILFTFFFALLGGLLFTVAFTTILFSTALPAFILTAVTPWVVPLIITSLVIILTATLIGNLPIEGLFKGKEKGSDDVKDREESLQVLGKEPSIHPTTSNHLDEKKDETDDFENISRETSDAASHGSRRLR